MRMLNLKKNRGQLKNVFQSAKSIKITKLSKSAKALNHFQLNLQHRRREIGDRGHETGDMRQEM